MTRDFEWDDAKAATNLAKHRTAFDEAVAVFADPEIVVVATMRPEDGLRRSAASTAASSPSSLSNGARLFA